MHSLFLSSLSIAHSIYDNSPQPNSPLNHASHLSVDVDHACTYFTAPIGISNCRVDASNSPAESTTAGAVGIFKTTTKSNLAQCIFTFPTPDGIPNASSQGDYDQPLGIQYLPESDALCVVFTTGEIVLLNVEGGGNEDLEYSASLVGCVDDGLDAMCWSPDLELVVFTTKSQGILVMTSDFQVVSDQPSIHSSQHGEEAPVALGWGKKSTQFHGSLGKEAASATELPAQIYLSTKDDGRSRIAWRGDGAHFVISSVSSRLLSTDSDSSPLRRILRFYDRECTLLNTSEDVVMLEHALAWKPSGNLIASTQQLPHRHDVLFFERNGLRHGNFSLPYSNVAVKELSWNADSTILALWLQSDIPSTSSSSSSCTSSFIEFWTCSNFKWTCKQRFGSQITSMQWDAEQSLIMHCLEGSAYIKTSLGRCVMKGHFDAPFSPGTVAHIQGTKVGVTPFKHQNVPPPMSSFELNVSEPVQYVSFAPFGDGDDLAIHTRGDDGEQVFLMKSQSISKPIAPHKQLAQISLSPWLSPVCCFRQVEWVSPSILVGIEWNSVTGTDHLVLLTLDESHSQIVSRRECVYYDPELNVRTEFARLFNNGELYVQNVDGVVYQVNVESLIMTQVAKFPVSCLNFAVFSYGQSREHLAFVGLSGRNKLYNGSGDIIASNCTSFTIHSDFLIYTTTKHMIQFFKRDGSASFNDASAILTEKMNSTSLSPYDESSRSTEIGSQIIMAPTADTSLILQMPRGNLETIYPLALVLSFVRACVLDREDYRTAFLCCRRHRIDLNVLIDLSYQRFCENISLFVTEVGNGHPDYLNLFISSLRNENVIKSKYNAGRISPESDAEDSWIGDKVNTVTRLLLDIFESSSRADDYIQPIITAHLKQTPPNFEATLNRIASLRERENNGVAESSLRYAIVLADVEQLYRTALGMYDFSLVIMVAEQSQKDPREYIPFLQEMQALPVNYRHFKIDDYLGKYEKALHSIVKCADEPDASVRDAEAFRFVMKHELFHLALELFEPWPKKHAHILTLYAEHKKEAKEFSEAGLLFDMAGLLESALACYFEAGLWKEAFGLAFANNLDASIIANMVSSFTSKLIDRHKYYDAARILLEYGKEDQVTEAIDLLLQANRWCDANRTIHKLGRPELLKTKLCPALEESRAQFMRDVEEMTETFTKRKDRLVQVRVSSIELKLKQKQIAMDADDRLDDIDMFSDTSSMATSRFTGSMASTFATQMTSHSGRTARTRRKIARKRASGKDPAFEEEYLVNSLRKLIEEAHRKKDEVHDLLRALLLFGSRRHAQEVQHSFDQLLKVMEEHTKAIFRPPVAAGMTSIEDLKTRMFSGESFSDIMADAAKTPRNDESMIALPKVSSVEWRLSLI